MVLFISESRRSFSRDEKWIYLKEVAQKWELFRPLSLELLLLAPVTESFGPLTAEMLPLAALEKMVS